MRLSPIYRAGFAFAVVLACSVPALLARRGPRPQRPRISPHEVHDFDVDGARFSVNYGRPSVRGRVIWGGLVPWDHWWMPGADEATIMTTSAGIVLGGLTVPAGAHTLYMLPNEHASTLIVSNETGQFHTVYHPDRDLGHVDFSLRRLSDSVEMLTWAAQARPGGGILTLTWADREYGAVFTVVR